MITKHVSSFYYQQLKVTHEKQQKELVKGLLSNIQLVDISLYNFFVVFVFLYSNICFNKYSFCVNKVNENKEVIR